VVLLCYIKTQYYNLFWFKIIIIIIINNNNNNRTKENEHKNKIKETKRGGLYLVAQFPQNPDTLTFFFTPSVPRRRKPYHPKPWNPSHTQESERERVSAMEAGGGCAGVCDSERERERERKQPAIEAIGGGRRCDG